MRKVMSVFSISLLLAASAYTQGYNTGDKAADFKLQNVDGKYVSLSDYPDAKGFVVIFTCNHCPYAQAYQDRIIALDKKYKPLGYPVIAINPNDPQINADDSYDNMVKRAKEKGYTFPYLFDNTQETYRKYGARKTPHVFLLQKENKNLVVRYIGAIDDNFEEASKVTQTYAANAIDALLANRMPDPAVTKAIGCSIKDKQAQK
jgi:peroxiredoxin